MNAPLFSAIICAHNPRMDYFNETLCSVRRQIVPFTNTKWELLIIDNGSDDPLASRLDLSWHPNARVIREDKLGLTHARLKSFYESLGEILIYIDDDNIIKETYFNVMIEAFLKESSLGAIGGKVLPRYEIEPPSWFAQTGISLACRDLGEEKLVKGWRNVSLAERKYPECAPIGAGMGIRRAAYVNYVNSASKDPVRLALGRKGQNLASGEDNDIIMSVLEQGWNVAYLPELQIEHLIAGHRLSEAYLSNYAYSSNLTWVQVLSAHGVCPWNAISPRTAWVRKARAFVRERAWSDPVRWIRWRGACGLIEGRARISSTI